MTETESGSLRAWLAQRSDDELAELLARRPDLAVPPPATVGVLAARAEQRSSVARVADGLSTAHFVVLELLATAGADTAPVKRTELGIGRRLTKKATDALLGELRALALVWGTDSALRVVPSVLAVFPWRIDRRDAPHDLGEGEIASLLTACSPDERRLLDTLARSGSLGRTRDAAPGTPPDRPVQKLLAASLLRHVDDDTVELPHPVRQVVRGEAVFDPAATTPPALTTTSLATGDVDAAGAGEALELVRHCDDVLAALGVSPAPMLRAGGLGVRELKRLAKSTGIAEPRLALLVELLDSAGLIASGDPDPPIGPDSGEHMWAPTTAADSWSNSSTAHRWSVLAAAWLDMARQPRVIGTKDPQTDKPIAALSLEVRAQSAPEDRRAVLTLLADETPGTAVPVPDVARRLAWLRPRWGARLRVAAVEAMLDEARVLGLVGRGAVTTPGRALLADGDVETAMERALPEPIDYVLVQADLTVLAPGPLTPDLLDRITLVADVESAGAASMYRITEDTIRRALDAGTSAAELHSLFHTHSRTPVPQGLDYLVDDVARRHGQLRAGVASSFVRSDDPALLGEVLASPVAERLALRGIAPTVAVSQAPLRELLDELRAAGFSPAGEDSSGTLVDLRPRGSRVHVQRSRRAARPATASREQREAIVRTMRAGDVAASASTHGGVRTDGSRAGSAATIALLGRAARDRTKVAIGYVDAAGVASNRIVEPISVGGGQLEALDPGAGGIRRFTLHRITSVGLVDG
ncbi:DNA-binding protein [Rhodococcus rhodnii]|uniref:Helicase XPB/Ssl2 N-terminal domain-containing protein n=2 Tax=Rhodococcus rhodnii TaxID=38312 RepID=R7WRB4_9NOCA|nr:helicase-associated domain-containing protein [Rhodococcus rhodnii]EOM77862.1 hypothetical protein Rrhod_0755 [Rhodococcus rhodnii LMG 5362]TXG88964.1 DNA-binding protein [Rhodococcus rhodnii]